MSVAVTFIGPFRTAGGPLYVKGDKARLDDWMAEEAIRQGAALRDQEPNYGEKSTEAPRNKMVAAAPQQKG